MDNPVLEERVAHLIRAVDDLSESLFGEPIKPCPQRSGQQFAVGVASHQTAGAAHAVVG